MEVFLSQKDQLTACLKLVVFQQVQALLIKKLLVMDYLQPHRREVLSQNEQLHGLSHGTIC